MRYVARNVIGLSEYGDTVSVAFSDLPAQPTVPTKNAELSTETKLVIEWDLVSDTQIPGGAITNYRILMDNDTSGDFKEIYSASASLKQFAVDGLIRGAIYRFKIQARNFNGWGPESQVALFYACVRPSVPAIPILTATSASTMTLEWKTPSNDGGCPITSYALFRDDGATGNPTKEINVDNDVSVRDKPTLRTLIVNNFDNPSQSLGKEFAFQVSAFNREGETRGSIARYIFSKTPEKPTTAPTMQIQS